MKIKPIYLYCAVNKKRPKLDYLNLIDLKDKKYIKLSTDEGLVKCKLAVIK